MVNSPWDKLTLDDIVLSTVTCLHITALLQFTYVDISLYIENCNFCHSKIYVLTVYTELANSKTIFRNTNDEQITLQTVYFFFSFVTYKCSLSSKLIFTD